MRNRFKRLLREFNSVEKGHLFILTLLWIFLAALIIPPTLGHVHTTLKTERIYDEKTYAVYAADSGIEDAMWHIKEGDLATLLTVPTTYDPYDFETGWQYPLDEQINGDDVTVSVENIWIPEGLPDDNPGYIEGPDDADIAEQYAETDRLMVTGRVSTVPADPEVDPYTYEIKLTYKPVAGDALSVESIGAWLPDGFDYVEGSSSLEEEVLPVPLYQQNLEAPVEPYEPCSGGKVVIWNWDPALHYTARHNHRKDQLRLHFFEAG
ncbi:MAG: hypothetical protein FJZ95_02595 [Chloroflexi bacterium]|nr:hypothetical protein [Chloroflexota bacterium]